MFFHDRSYAGSLLANKISENALDLDNTIVLAIPNGGVPIAYEIAKKFKIPLDVLLYEKIKSSPNSNILLGIIFENNRTLLNENLIKKLGHEISDLSSYSLKSTNNLHKKCQILRKEYPPIPWSKKDIILIDDGHSSSDFIDLIISFLKTESVGKIIFGTPVAEKEYVEKLSRVADRVEVVLIPPDFGFIGEWYEDFLEIDNEIVKDLLSECSLLLSRSKVDHVSIPLDDFQIECDVIAPEKVKSWVVFASTKGDLKKTLYKKDFAINLSKESYGVLMFDLVCKKENNIGNLLNSSMLSNQIIAATKWLAQNMSDEVYLPVSFIGHKFAAMAIAIALERLQQVVKIESFISLDGRLDLIDKKDLLRILVPTMLVVHKNKIDIVDLNKNTAKTLPNSRVSLISSFQGFFETQINCDEVSKLSIEWLDNHYLKLDQAPIQQKSSILKEHAL